MKRFLATLFSALLFPALVYAQGQFPTAGNKNVKVPGSVAMCLDANGNAIPSVNGGNCIGAGGGSSGAVFGPDAIGIAPTHPPVMVGGTSDGSGTGTAAIWKVGAGGIGFINCSNCSGSGISVSYGGAIGAVGTPGGFKDPATGFFQPLQGDVTNGQWVNIKSAVSLGVTGTFWPYTLGQQVSGSSVPVVLPAAQITTLTPPAAITNFANETGGNLATLVTDFGAPGATACTTDTASCNQNQQLQRLAQRLTSIVTALGSPFQAGGTATLNAETTKVIGTVRTLGNVGAIVDFAGQAASSPANSWLVGAQFNTTPTTLTNGQASPLQMDSAGNLLVNIKAGAAAGGTSSNFAAAFPSAGTAIGVKNGANMVNLTADGSSNLNVNCTVGCSGGTFNNNADAIATSSTNGQVAAWLYGYNGTTFDRLQVDASKNLKVNVQSAVGLAAASTTSGQTGSIVMGAVTTSAPSYTTAQTNYLSLTTTGGLRVDGSGVTQPVSISGNQAVNVAQVNGVTPLMGNGVTGTGSQRVTIASDNTAFSVNATLSAETTKVIGTVRNVGNAGANFDAATAAAVPANALYAGMNQGGNLTGLTGTSGNLNVQCANCSGSGVSTADEAAFTAGTSLFAGTGGFFQTTATNNALTNGQQGMLQMTANRAAFTNLRNAAGTEIGTSGAPVRTDPTGTTTQPVSLAANQSVNTAQVNGVTTLTGTGAVGTGAQRIAVGTDTATIAGSAPGTAGTASANVVTVQGVASMTKLLVTPDSVALPANQSVNVAQFGGVSTATGQVAVSTAPVTATNTALVTALRPDSPGIIALGQTTKSASVPVTIASDQLGASTAANSLPITVGPALLGSYCMGANTGTMAAGLAAAAPIYSFRYGGANLAIVRKVTAEADDITTAFVAGAAKLDLIAARSFSASDTGGTAATLTGNNGKLRTSYATTAISDLRISSTATLTAGTRTLDAQPLASVEFAVPTSIDAGLLPTTELYKSAIGESPFVLANNEGFVIQATVPGTGTWVASVRVCWDEVSAF